ncbi:MAG TPA: ATP-dependent RNA helicase HrpA, partial [Acidimicrobiales bacterium]|nr:ATP-dependent RNA helicase HrpA [Acidimicrobiales bacterium]
LSAMPAPPSAPPTAPPPHRSPGHDRSAEARRRALRAEARPREVRYPDLPIAGRRDDVLAALRDNQVVVVAGETGSGKSTQLPKMCLELGRGVDGLIGHTQPRRLAARTVASRIADELGTELGDLVGYSVRFTDRVSDRTLVRLMTDGLLLAELQRDRLLRRYDTIIVDEAHERSLNIDFLLGYLTTLLPRRPDLKVVVTSATIDTRRFADHFDAPVVEVSGRTYPVEVRYRPLDRDQVDGIRAAVQELRQEGPGDVLVFLSGEREIRDAAIALADDELAGTEIVPLYARLSAAEQQRAFRPHPGRRIVLATNVAETSITVPGVRYVVDPGTARISRYNRRTKVQRLPIEPVSRASADQRAGRCGRVAPGICIRLYDEDDLVTRPEFTEPEILRTNLASVILQMAALRLGDVESFPFVDPPDARAVRDAVALLVELGAMRPDRTLTRTGRQLARLPVDPRLGRMVLAAGDHGCVREAVVVAAALSIQDVRERPTDRRAEADELHSRFADPDSDVVTLLNLWRHLHDAQRSLSSSAFRRMCRAEMLHHGRVREWQDLVRQLREAAHGLSLRRNDTPAPAEQVHRAVLSGLLSHVGMYDRTTRDHVGARQAHFSIARGSVLHRRTPEWVMAAELVETDRLWARVVARIDPSWIEPAAGHLVRRTYGEPWWDARRGTAMTTERVTLYGLPVVEGRRVTLGRVDPALARRMFIDHALVAGEWEADHPFVAANRRLVEELRELEERTRRRDLLAGEEQRAAFFDARLPGDVVSARHLDRWWRDARRHQPDLLTFTRADLVDPDAADVDLDAFPTTWRQGDLDLDVSYTFGPGAPDDGVTVHVPLAQLNRVSPTGFDWQVPGHRLDLATALVRSLPKQVRRHLVPAPDRARDALRGASPQDGPLLEVLARRLAALAGEPVSARDFDMAKVPDHLRVRFRVEGADGHEVAAGRDLAALQARLGGRVRQAVADAAPGIERRGLTTWDLGTLPRTVDTEAGGRPVRGYPALVDEGDGVAVRVMATPADQAAAMGTGTRRLLVLAVPAARREAERRLRAVPALAAAPSFAPSVGDLAEDCVAAAADRIVAAEGGPAWDDEGFARLEAAARARLPALSGGAATRAARLVAAAASLDARLGALRAPALRPAVEDARHQVHALVHPGFVAAAGLARLGDLARYLEAVRVRLDKLGDRPARDRELMDTVRSLEERYAQAVATLPPERRGQPDVVEVRWLLEELRVSFFAQALGTSRPVSAARLRRAVAALAP